MRRKIVAGNWKMFGTRAEARVLFEGIAAGSNTYSKIDVIVFPSYIHLQQAKSILKESSVAWGGQNLYPGEKGAFTGEISGPMLVDYGCHYVLIGHSERRSIFHEDLDVIIAKFKSAQQFGLKPILCIGETKEQREKGETRNVLTKQLVSVIEAVGIEAFKKAIIAYEPVWAIGTGLTATPLQAQEVHEFIRDQIKNCDSIVAKSIQILYGGSVKADNAAGLFVMPDIDGALVGGASLEAKSFLAICQAADQA